MEKIDGQNQRVRHMDLPNNLMSLNILMYGEIW